MHNPQQEQEYLELKQMHYQFKIQCQSFKIEKCQARHCPCQKSDISQKISTQTKNYPNYGDQQCSEYFSQDNLIRKLDDIQLSVIDKNYLNQSISNDFSESNGLSQQSQFDSRTEIKNINLCRSNELCCFQIDQRVYSQSIQLLTEFQELNYDITPQSVRTRLSSQNLNSQEQIQQSFRQSSTISYIKQKKQQLQHLINQYISLYSCNKRQLNSKNTQQVSFVSHDSDNKLVRELSIAQNNNDGAFQQYYQSSKNIEESQQNFDQQQQLENKIQYFQELIKLTKQIDQYNKIQRQLNREIQQITLKIQNLRDLNHKNEKNEENADKQFQYQKKALIQKRRLDEQRYIKIVKQAQILEFKISRLHSNKDKKLKDKNLDNKKQKVSVYVNKSLKDQSFLNESSKIKLKRIFHTYNIRQSYSQQQNYKQFGQAFTEKHLINKRKNIIFPEHLSTKQMNNSCTKIYKNRVLSPIKRQCSRKNELFNQCIRFPTNDECLISNECRLSCDKNLEYCNYLLKDKINQSQYTPESEYSQNSFYGNANNRSAYQSQILPRQFTIQEDQKSEKIDNLSQIMQQKYIELLQDKKILPDKNIPKKAFSNQLKNITFSQKCLKN